MALPVLSLDQLSLPYPLELPNGQTRNGWAGDWVTGPQRHAAWRAHSASNETIKRMLADDLFIQEGEARWSLFVAMIDQWSDDGQAITATSPLLAEKLSDLLGYLDRVRERYRAAYGYPCPSDVRLEIVSYTGPSLSEYGAGPLAPVPGEIMAPPGSPRRGPEPVQISINAAPAKERSKDAPPLGRLATHTRGGASLDERRLT